MSDDEALVYVFSTELRQDKAVSDASYARALTRLGERAWSTSSPSTAITTSSA